MLLERKNAVIYGGGPIGGAAVARTFAREGAQVFLAARNRDRLDRVAHELRGAGGSVDVRQLDALDGRAVDEHADAVVAEAGSSRPSSVPTVCASSPCGPAASPRRSRPASPGATRSLPDRGRDAARARREVAGRRQRRGIRRFGDGSHHDRGDDQRQLRRPARLDRALVGGEGARRAGEQRHQQSEQEAGPRGDKTPIRVRRGRRAAGQRRPELTPKTRELTWELYGPLAEASEPLLTYYTDAELELLIELQRRGTELQEQMADRLREKLAKRRRGSDWSRAYRPRT